MTLWATLKNRLCPVLFFPLFLEAIPDCAVVAGAGKLFSTQSVMIIPLKVTVPYRCSTVDGLLAPFKSWNKQNANGWQQFNNCRQLLRKFSFHLIAHNEIMRYWDKDDNFSQYTYQNPYFDCQVGSAWRHNAVSDPRGALMKRISPASIENVWHFVTLVSAYGNRFSHEIYAVIYIFILVKKKQNKNPSMTESLKSFFLLELTHQLKGPRLPSRPSALRVEPWRISLQFMQPWRWSANPESQTETTTCYVWHSLEVLCCAWGEMHHLTGLLSPVSVITSKQIQKSA